jgi:hypothetical protein
VSKFRLLLIHCSFDLPHLFHDILGIQEKLQYHEAKKMYRRAARTKWCVSVVCVAQGCVSRFRGIHARGLNFSLHAGIPRFSAEFTCPYIYGICPYIYGIILKYTANTGDLVYFWGFWVVLCLCIRCAPCVSPFVWCARLSQLIPTATAISISWWPGISSHTKTQPFLLP